jgi:N-acetyl sugar amidotransferase
MERLQVRGVRVSGANPRKSVLPHVIRSGEPGYRRCVVCIMDTTDPEIRFDGKGRCSHCKTVESYRSNWDPRGNSQKLEVLLEQIRKDGRGRDYDVISGLSGGVDSSYLAYLAKQWGLRTLLVHVDTGWNSELAVKNIENIVNKVGFDLVTHVVDWEEMQDVQYAFLKASVPNQDIPQDHAISAGFYSLAVRHGIRWSLSGSNFACESILPSSWGYDNLDLLHIKDIHRRFGRRPLRNFPQMSYFDYGVRYQLLRRMSVAKPLDLIAYTKADAMLILERELGWRYYGGKHYESRFTKFFQAWYLPVKWGYDKRLAHLSSLIVSGQISRDDALREFEEGALPHAEVEADKDYMANKLALTREEFDALMRLPNQPHSTFRQTPVWLKTAMREWALKIRRRIKR